MWHPLAEFEKKGWKKLYHKDGKPIGHSSILLSETKIPDAYYCAACNIVTGIFEVEKMN